MKIHNDLRTCYAPLLTEFIEEFCEIGSLSRLTRDDEVRAVVNVWFFECGEDPLEWAVLRELLVEAGVTVELWGEQRREWVRIECEYKPERDVVEVYEKEYGMLISDRNDSDPGCNVDDDRSVDTSTDELIALLEASTARLRRL